MATLQTDRPRRWGRGLSAICRSLAALVFALLAMHAAPRAAQALDPTRTLSQALHRIWQTQQGLPQATIYCIRQTDDGYLWLGTQSVLARFDGMRFTTMRLQDSNSKSPNKVWINDLVEDSRHNLWIATEGDGLIRWTEAEVQHYDRASGLPSDDIEWVLADPNGDIWAGVRDGVIRLGNTIKVYGRADGVASDRVRAGGFDANGRLWIGGDGDILSYWDGERFVSRRIQSLAPEGSVNALLGARDGSLWIGADNGLVRVTENGERHFTAADGLSHDVVLCLAEAKRGGVWAGGKNGISRLQPSPDAASQDYEIESFRSHDGLSQSTVYALCEDREGSLWVGTKRGLNQFSDRRTLLYTMTDGLPSNNVGPVLQDSTGRVWVGTLGAGLGRFDGRRFASSAAKGELPSNMILSLGEHDGALWIGTDGGLTRTQNGVADKTFTTVDGLPSNVVTSLCSDRGGTLWAGTSAGLVRWRDGRFEPPAGEDELLRAPISLLSKHGDGVLAASAEGNLFRCDDGRLDWFDRAHAEYRDIAAIFEDRDGRVWLGTRGSGLILAPPKVDPADEGAANKERATADRPGDDPPKIARFTMKDGLHDDDISGIMAGDQDQLWMACSQGIFYVRVSDLLKFAAGDSASVYCRPFTPLDAQRTIECQAGVQPSICRLQDGTIWFSTTHGLIVIDPTNLVRNLPPAPVLIEQMAVNGAIENLSRLQSLPPGRTNVSFQYAALSFVSPTRMTYRYMLEDFDKDWVEAGMRREAFYTNLPPGDYRFRVAAANSDGVVTEGRHPVSFTIEPHFYQRRWFWPLFALGAVAMTVGAGWAGIRFRMSQMRRQMQMVVGERSRIARELHDTLMQGFSGVTMEMQALSVRLQPSAERRTLEEIIRDAGVCLREARRSVAGLRSGGQVGLAATIADAARQITETQAVRLNLRLHNVEQPLSADAQYNLLRIAQEAVTNAVKHANCGTIDVTLESSPKRLSLTIVDDGAGFDTDRDGSPGHYGLIGMRERANQIGAQLTLESAPGHGARISVTLPMLQPTREPTPTGSLH